MQARDIIGTRPDVKGSISEALVRYIDECYACAQACAACADACLAEESVQRLRQCIRLNLDCADICAATGALASRRTGSQSGGPGADAPGLRARLPRLRAGVSTPRRPARALPDLRRVLPSLSAGL